MNIGEVLDTLHTQWSAALASDDVQVFSGPVDQKTAGGEYVYVIGGDMDKGKMIVGTAAVPSALRETWTLTGEIMGMVTDWTGDVEGSIKAARDRSQDILTVMEANSTISNIVTVAFSGGDIDQTYGPGWRRCSRAFELSIEILLV